MTGTHLNGSIIAATGWYHARKGTLRFAEVSDKEAAECCEFLVLRVDIDDACAARGGIRCVRRGMPR
jgi:hypothetical protein